METWTQDSGGASPNPVHLPTDFLPLYSTKERQDWAQGIQRRRLQKKHTGAGMRRAGGVSIYKLWDREQRTACLGTFWGPPLSRRHGNPLGASQWEEEQEPPETRIVVFTEILGDRRELRHQVDHTVWRVILYDRSPMFPGLSSPWLEHTTQRGSLSSPKLPSCSLERNLFRSQNLGSPNAIYVPSARISCKQADKGPPRRILRLLSHLTLTHDTHPGYSQPPLHLNVTVPALHKTPTHVHSSLWNAT